MATDNRGVMVYLNLELERELEQYCINNNITRKNKEGVVLPSLGTGILQYLKSTLLNAAPCTVPSPSLDNAPSNRLSTGLTKDEILELIAKSNTNNVPSTVLARAEVSAIAKKEIDRALGSIKAEITDLKTILSNVSSSSPLAYVPNTEEVENAILVTRGFANAVTPQDPTNWEQPIAELASEGMSSSQIAERLNLLGFTNTKGGAVSRQSIENYLSRHPDLKATYEKARKKGD